jgi:hypothetical protein
MIVGYEKKKEHPSSQTRCYWLARTRHRRTISGSFRSFTQRMFSSVSIALASLKASLQHQIIVSDGVWVRTFFGL